MSSTGLSALTQVPTMSNVWLPRWFVKSLEIEPEHLIIQSSFRYNYKVRNKSKHS